MKFPLTLPTTTLLMTSIAVATPTADFNQSGVVDTDDLVVLSSNLNLGCSGDCATDLNLDGVTDSADMMILLQQWGPVQGSAGQPSQESNSASNDSSTSQLIGWAEHVPVLLDGIYYDQNTKLFSHGGYDRWFNAEEYNQGERVKAWELANGVEVQPIVYGAVDWDHDDTLTDEDKANFAAWLDATVPADYDGPICLDLEGQWWSMLSSQNQVVMDYAIEFYLENLEYAKSLRPHAKIGFWGLPKKSHTDPEHYTAAVDRLINACTGLFPDVYENNVGGNDEVRLRTHIERVIGMVQAKVPVYVHAFVRYKINSSGYRYFHEMNEFKRDQVQSALDAVWTDNAGNEHGIAGISIWDAYVYVGSYTDAWSEMSMEERKAYWDDVDVRHVEYLTEMKLLIDAAGPAAQARIVIASQAQQQQTAEAQAAAQATAEELLAEHSQQSSRLIRILNARKAALVRVTKTYKKSAKVYRSMTKKWSSAKKALALVKSKYGRGSSQYKQALSAYKKVRAAMRSASKKHQSKRKAYTAKRTKWNRARKQWKAAQANWEQMSNIVNSIAVSN